MLEFAKVQFRIVLSVAVLLLVSASPALAIPFALADLLEGGEIIVGDKRFFNFRDFSSTVVGTNTLPITSAQIQVEGAIVGDELGLRFSSDDWLSSVPPFLGPTESQTTEFRYDVEVLAAQSIIGTSLSYVTDIPGIGGETRVTETVSSLPALILLATSEVFTDQFDFNFEEKLADQDALLPQSLISVHNRIYVEDSGVTISEFTQTFQQQSVPEPGTTVLLVVGIVFAAVMRRLV